MSLHLSAERLGARHPPLDILSSLIPGGAMRISQLQAAPRSRGQHERAQDMRLGRRDGDEPWRDRRQAHTGAAFLWVLHPLIVAMITACHTPVLASHLGAIHA